ERAAYPGLFDFSTPYRSTALFWEMNVGGAAIDGFLVLTVPFSVYAVLRAADVWRWCLAALLAVIAGYACLTSFSRAVYLAVGVSLVVLAVMLSARRRLFASPATGRLPRAPPPLAPWRRWGGRMLVAVLIVEVLLVFVLGDFMGRRVSASERDLVGRLEHWSEGLALLRGPSDFFFGRGLGRFPANYSQAVPAHALPGRLRIIDEFAAGRYLRLSGPPRGIARQGAFDLLQRVPPLLEGSYAVAMDLRAPQPVRLEVGVCQRHLLYDATCRQAAVMVPGGKPQWRRFSLLLPAAGVDAGQDRPPALAFLSLRLAGPGDFVDIDNLRVVDAAGRDLLVNGDFSDGLTRWFFAGRHYFVPWHIDNLFLETLIDQGVIGLLLLLTLLAMAFANLLRGPGRGH
ncbi:MAG: O-antigen ligase family protein, partial [Candidatus Accumulibacter sp.]|nr:O-antigen ligase family protein [Accumulibacter sp.]